MINRTSSSLVGSIVGNILVYMKEIDFIIKIVLEFVYRALLIICSIYMTIYVLISNTYTFIQYIIVNIYSTGAGYNRDSTDVIHKIMLYITIVIHVPIVYIHTYIYIKPILYKHQTIYILYYISYTLVVLYGVHYVTHYRMIPIIIVFIMDMQYNIGQEYQYDVYTYRLNYLYIIAINVFCIIMIIAYITNTHKVAKISSIYRRIILRLVGLMYAISDDISGDIIWITFVCGILVSEFIIILHLFILYVLKKRVNPL